MSDFETIPCPSCGAGNQAGMGFCGSCGAPLGVPSTPVPPTPPPPPSQVFSTPNPEANPEPAFSTYTPPAPTRAATLPSGPLTDSGQSVSTAMIIEIVAGFFGFLGIGWIYAGRTGQGIGLLLGWWALIAIGVIFAVVTFGFGGLCFCLAPVVPVLSGLWLKSTFSKS